MATPYLVRPIQSGDNSAMASVIRTVMPEFGACGPGFAITDAEVDALCKAYSAPRSRYYVVEIKGKIVGGAGVAPLQGGNLGVCELRKMYLLQEARGKGIGRKLLELCLESAREFGYMTCYLETLKTMTAAIELYHKAGFVPVDKPMGATGHFSCDAWYIKPL